MNGDEPGSTTYILDKQFPTPLNIRAPVTIPIPPIPAPPVLNAGPLRASTARPAPVLLRIQHR